MKTLAPLLLLPLVVLADVGARQADTYIGPVRDLDALRDGGLFMTRDAGEQVGRLSCVAATGVETGCITPGSQTLSGTKTWNGDQRIVGHAHASLTACDGAHKGTLQTCTDDGALVFCNGTSNVEYGGSTSKQTLAVLPWDRLFHGTNGYLGTFTLPYAFTVSTVSGMIGAGAGTTINVRFSDGTNNCDCAIDCTAGTISACSGNCAYAANTLVLAQPNSDGCTTPIIIHGPLTVSGYRP